jgi:hypothetical protein
MNKLVTKIINIQEDLNSICNEYIKPVKKHLLESSIEVNINEEKIEINTNSKSIGLYLIQIKPIDNEYFKHFETNWLNEKKSKFSPNLIQSRFENNKPITLNNLYPFYLGKAEDIQKRINEHFFHNIENPTYSLKLKHKTDLIKSALFYYSFFEINMTVGQNKPSIQFILTNLESELRKEINPWIGKQ